MSDNSNSNLIPVTGLWLNKSKDGQTTYMTGYMGSARIIIFRNQHKKEDKHPDYQLFVTEGKPRNEDSAGKTDDPPRNDGLPF